MSDKSPAIDALAARAVAADYLAHCKRRSKLLPMEFDFVFRRDAGHIARLHWRPRLRARRVIDAELGRRCVDSVGGGVIAAERVNLI